MAAPRKKAEPKAREIVAVRYAGSADVKEFFGLTFDRSNDHTIPVSEIDADMLVNLRSQPDFRLVYG